MSKGWSGGGGGWMGIGGELGGVLTRAAQSNITAVGTTPANIAARWKFLPCFQIFSPHPFFPRRKTPDRLHFSRRRALKYFTSAGRNITET